MPNEKEIEEALAKGREALLELRQAGGTESVLEATMRTMSDAVMEARRLLAAGRDVEALAEAKKAESYILDAQRLQQASQRELEMARALGVLDVPPAMAAAEQRELVETVAREAAQEAMATREAMRESVAAAAAAPTTTPTPAILDRAITEAVQRTVGEANQLAFPPRQGPAPSPMAGGLIPAIGRGWTWLGRLFYSPPEVLPKPEAAPPLFIAIPGEGVFTSPAGGPVVREITTYIANPIYGPEFVKRVDERAEKMLGAMVEMSRAQAQGAATQIEHGLQEGAAESRSMSLELLQRALSGQGVPTLPAPRRNPLRINIVSPSGQPLALPPMLTTPPDAPRLGWGKKGLLLAAGGTIVVYLSNTGMTMWAWQEGGQGGGMGAQAAAKLKDAALVEEGAKRLETHAKGIASLLNWIPGYVVVAWLNWGLSAVYQAKVYRLVAESMRQEAAKVGKAPAANGAAPGAAAAAPSKPRVRLVHWAWRGGPVAFSLVDDRIPDELFAAYRKAVAAGHATKKDEKWYTPMSSESVPSALEALEAAGFAVEVAAEAAAIIGPRKTPSAPSAPR